MENDLELNDIYERFRSSEVPATRSQRFRTYSQAFSGKALISWLCDVGIARNAGEAEVIGGRLYDAGYIHISGRQHHFRSKDYLYQLRTVDSIPEIFNSYFSKDNDGPKSLSSDSFTKLPVKSGRSQHVYCGRLFLAGIHRLVPCYGVLFPAEGVLLLFHDRSCSLLRYLIAVHSGSCKYFASDSRLVIAPKSVSNSRVDLMYVFTFTVDDSQGSSQVKGVIEQFSKEQKSWEGAFADAGIGSRKQVELVDTSLPPPPTESAPDVSGGNSRRRKFSTKYSSVTLSQFASVLTARLLMENQVRNAGDESKGADTFPRLQSNLVGLDSHVVSAVATDTSSQGIVMPLLGISAPIKATEEDRAVLNLAGRSLPPKLNVNLIMSIPAFREHLKKFLKKNHCAESYYFLFQAHAFRMSTRQKALMASDAQSMFNEFIRPLSKGYVNIDGVTQKEISDEISNKYGRDLFVGAESAILRMIRLDVFRRFLASEYGRKCQVPIHMADMLETLDNGVIPQRSGRSKRRGSLFFGGKDTTPKFVRPTRRRMSFSVVPLEEDYGLMAHVESCLRKVKEQGGGVFSRQFCRFYGVEHDTCFKAAGDVKSVNRPLFQEHRSHLSQDKEPLMVLCGMDLVTWLCVNLFSKCRYEARLFGQRMLDAGILRLVTTDVVYFRDGVSLYSLAPPLEYGLATSAAIRGAIAEKVERAHEAKNEGGEGESKQTKQTDVKDSDDTSLDYQFRCVLKGVARYMHVDVFLNFDEQVMYAFPAVDAIAERGSREAAFQVERQVAKAIADEAAAKRAAALNLSSDEESEDEESEEEGTAGDTQEAQSADGKDAESDAKVNDIDNTATTTATTATAATTSPQADSSATSGETPDAEPDSAPTVDKEPPATSAEPMAASEDALFSESEDESSSAVVTQQGPPNQVHSDSESSQDMAQILQTDGTAPPKTPEDANPAVEPSVSSSESSRQEPYQVPSKQQPVSISPHGAMTMRYGSGRRKVWSRQQPGDGVSMPATDGVAPFTPEPAATPVGKVTKRLLLPQDGGDGASPSPQGTPVSSTGASSNKRPILTLPAFASPGAMNSPSSPPGSHSSIVGGRTPRSRKLAFELTDDPNVNMAQSEPVKVSPKPDRLQATFVHSVRSPSDGSRLSPDLGPISQAKKVAAMNLLMDPGRTSKAARRRRSVMMKNGRPAGLAVRPVEQLEKASEGKIDDHHRQKYAELLKQRKKKKDKKKKKIRKKKERRTPQNEISVDGEVTSPPPPPPPPPEASGESDSDEPVVVREGDRAAGSEPAEKAKSCVLVETYGMAKQHVPDTPEVTAIPNLVRSRTGRPVGWARGGGGPPGGLLPDTEYLRVTEGDSDPYGILSFDAAECSVFPQDSLVQHHPIAQKLLDQVAKRRAQSCKERVPTEKALASCRMVVNLKGASGCVTEGTEVSFSGVSDTGNQMSFAAQPDVTTRYLAYIHVDAVISNSPPGRLLAASSVTTLNRYKFTLRCDGAQQRDRAVAALARAGVQFSKDDLRRREMSLGIEHLANERCQVFLGGSCGKTTWRRDIVAPLLQQNGISFYNPQVDDWKPALMRVEEAYKECCWVLFFVISKETRAVASMVEVAEYLSRRRYMVVVVEDIPEGTIIDGHKVSERERKDLNRGRAYLRECMRRHAAYALHCDSVEEATVQLIKHFNAGKEKYDPNSENCTIM